MLHDRERMIIADIARQLTIDSIDIDRWRGWVVYLLDCLEVAATIEPDYPELYETMLSELVADIHTRLEEGHW